MILAIGAVMMGCNIAAAMPHKYPFNKDVLKIVQDNVQDGAEIQLKTEPLEAVKDADIIVTSTWYPLPALK
jgi:ornithine carbamoyltransferase